MRKVNFESKRSPIQKHSRYLKALKKQSMIAYRYLMRNMINEIVDEVTQDKSLKKSELGSGWTGSTPKVSVNLDSIAEGVISRYMLALRWLMVGDYAGKEAKAAAKKVGIIDTVTPGLMQSSYLSAIDSYRQLYTDITGVQPGDVPPVLLQASIDQIVNRTNRYLDQVTVQINNMMLATIEKVAEDLNTKNMAKVHKKAQGKEDTEAALEEASQKVKSTVSKRPLIKELREAAKGFENNWQRTTVGEIGTATAAATHQAMHEVFGGTEDEMKVAWITSENERVCKFCNGISKDGAGSYKYYRLDELKPAGYNIGKKKANWLPAIPPVHPNCYCYLVYVPKGFKVAAGGDLVPE